MGAGAARFMFPEEGWAGAALVAAILAPTDAALGLGVFTDRSVPARIRRALNVEKQTQRRHRDTVRHVVPGYGHRGRDRTCHWLKESAIDLALATVVAVVVGIGGGWLILRARDRGWTSPSSDQFAVLAFALVSYTAAVAAGGNGFVAAFLGGMLFGARTARSFRVETEFTERVGLIASFAVWALFGALFVGPVLEAGVHVAPIVYAPLSLTFVRMAPVALALLGTGLDRASNAFIGWFGPGGLASVVFTLIAFESLEHADVGAGLLVEITTWIILLSVIAHGLTAKPFAAAYGRRVATLGPSAPERHRTPEPSLRRSLHEVTPGP